MDKPGDIRGKHYSKYVEDVKTLKRMGRLDEAEALLLELVDATETESRFTGWGVAPWYYEELAKIYRKQKEYRKEIDILTRYAGQFHTSGDAHQEALKERLEKAKQLLITKR